MINHADPVQHAVWTWAMDEVRRIAARRRPSGPIEREAIREAFYEAETLPEVPALHLTIDLCLTVHALYQAVMGCFCSNSQLVMTDLVETLEEMRDCCDPFLARSTLIKGITAIQSIPVLKQSKQVMVALAQAQHALD